MLASLPASGGCWPSWSLAGGCITFFSASVFPWPSSRHASFSVSYKDTCLDLGPTESRPISFEIFGLNYIFRDSYSQVLSRHVFQGPLFRLPPDSSLSSISAWSWQVPFPPWVSDALTLFIFRMYRVIVSGSGHTKLSSFNNDVPALS